MANKEKGKKHSFKVKKSIGATLLMLLLPLIILGTVGIIVFISYNARQVITEISLLDLKNEGEANAYKLGRNFQMITSKFGQYADTLETVNFEDREAMRKYIEPSASYAPVANSGIYISFDTDGGVIFANGLEVDMDARTRPWYAVGMENDTFVATDPYIDVTTETMCTTFVRKIDYYDGTKGVMGVDVYLADLQEEVNQLTPMKTGGSMVLTDDIIISYFDPELNGTLISESGSSYLEEVKAYVESGNEDPVIIKQNTTGVDYYVCEATIPGTPWVLISSVAVDDVMAEANAFMTFSLIAMILLVILIVAVILLTINKVITKPVNGLTESILKISDGDFTTSMPKDKGDEIGMISREMTRFVQIMNGAIGSIQSRAEQLQQDSESSKNASSQMSTQAGDQSVSMGQIQETMDDISNAVGELAENATNLAHAVSDLTEDGNQTNNTMLDLVEQAKVGQEDMTAVQQSMEKINDSMNEMNDVVVTVGDSAKEITDIVQMIDSIAEQTNLLSLNASIEAARAGEAGKGFAVVADEIGKLAQNSQDAAKEIGDIIRQITGLISDLAAKSQNNMDSINQSGEVVEKAGTSFNKIYDDLNETAEVMRQMIDKMGEVNDIASSVAAISEEQSASAEEITATIYTLTESASQIANESQGVEDVANSVSDSALAINDELSKFKIESDIQG